MTKYQQYIIDNIYCSIVTTKIREEEWQTSTEHWINVKQGKILWYESAGFCSFNKVIVPLFYHDWVVPVKSKKGTYSLNDSFKGGQNLNTSLLLRKSQNLPFWLLKTRGYKST